MRDKLISLADGGSKFEHLERPYDAYYCLHMAAGLLDNWERVRGELLRVEVDREGQVSSSKHSADMREQRENNVYVPKNKRTNDNSRGRCAGAEKHANDAATTATTTTTTTNTNNTNTNTNSTQRKRDTRVAAGRAARVIRPSARPVLVLEIFIQLLTLTPLAAVAVDGAAVLCLALSSSLAGEPLPKTVTKKD